MAHYGLQGKGISRLLDPVSRLSASGARYMCAEHLKELAAGVTRSRTTARGTVGLWRGKVGSVCV